MNTISLIQAKKIIMKSLAAIIIIIICIFALKALKQRSGPVANAGTKRTLKCSSVCVTENDTLWSIATEYYSDEYDGIHELINEIKSINKMSSDRIDAGNYIIVPYYD